MSASRGMHQGPIGIDVLGHARAIRPGEEATALPTLPVPLTSFVGRHAIVTEIVTALRRGDVRLLTVTGPGGVGKTRLALRVAETMQHELPGGAGFVPLAAIDDPARLLPTIAAGLRLPEGDRRSLLSRVCAYLGDWDGLLVLDNFEQIVDAAPVLARIMARCPRMTFLLTSRAVLRISGEHVYPVPPMSLDRECNPTDDAALPDAANSDDRASEAVRLFIDRANAAGQEIARDTPNEHVIAEICARLDGLPLAIELAASRSSLLIPPLMLAQLDRRLPLLTSGPRDQPERLQTMRNAIAWSYDLLSDEARGLFRCLTVFVDGFTLAAAAAVCDQASESILAGLEALVDQSLIRVVADATDEPRFTTLATIREYGLDQLAGTGEADTVLSRHARFFLDLAERGDREVDGPDAVAWLARLDHDRANLSAALTWLIEQGQVADALRMATALWRYWRIRGDLSEGHEALTRALALAGPAPVPVRADALWKLGYLLFYLGEYEPAQERMEQSVALFDRAGDRAGAAMALDALGLVLRVQRDFAVARAHHERALAHRRDLGDRVGQPTSLANLGMLALDRGDLAEARRRLEEALAIAEDLEATHEIGERSINLGRLSLAEGNLDAARAHIERSLAIFEATADHTEITNALDVLSRIAGAAGDERGAISIVVRCLRLRLRMGMHRMITDIVEFLGCVLIGSNAPLATRLLAAVEADRELTGVDRLPQDTDAWTAATAAAGDALGDDRFAELWRAGAELTVIAAAQEAVTALGNVVAAEMAPNGAAGLTPREVEVLQLVARGLPNREIAAELYLSQATVKRHLTTIFGKLDVSSRSAATTRAHELGIVAPDA